MMDTHRELENLDTACAGVVQGLNVAGLTGQLHLHACLEDLKQTLIHVHAGGQLLSPSEKSVARDALLRCHGQLQRADQMLFFIGSLLERQLELHGGGSDYTIAAYGGGSRTAQWRRNHGSLEAEG